MQIEGERRFVFAVACSAQKFSENRSSCGQREDGGSRRRWRYREQARMSSCRSWQAWKQRKRRKRLLILLVNAQLIRNGRASEVRLCDYSKRMPSDPSAQILEPEVPRKRIHRALRNEDRPRAIRPALPLHLCTSCRTSSTCTKT